MTDLRFPKKEKALVHGHAYNMSSPPMPIHSRRAHHDLVVEPDWKRMQIRYTNTIPIHSSPPHPSVAMASIPLHSPHRQHQLTFLSSQISLSTPSPLSSSSTLKASGSLQSIITPRTRPFRGLVSPSSSVLAPEGPGWAGWSVSRSKKRLRRVCLTRYVVVPVRPSPSRRSDFRVCCEYILILGDDHPRRDTPPSTAHHPHALRRRPDIHHRRPSLLIQRTDAPSNPFRILRCRQLAFERLGREEECIGEPGSGLVGRGRDD